MIPSLEKGNEHQTNLELAHANIMNLTNDGFGKLTVLAAQMEERIAQLEKLVTRMEEEKKEMEKLEREQERMSQELGRLNLSLLETRLKR